MSTHTHAPHDASRTTFRAPSERSVNFLVMLAAERTPQVTEDQIRAWAATVEQRDVSAKIDWLKEQPLVNPDGNRTHVHEIRPLPEVPAGRYAVDGEDGELKFYRVNRPTEGRWAGRTFVDVQASDEYHAIRGLAATRTILAKIAVDPQAAMARYGHELNHCGYCGRTLTDEVSRARGIGPVCLAKLGW